ncbi:MAG: histidine triad nucleotide-binding protein [Zetaproteobacteria bacterium]|nr:histidine triad nucleotide-binding protein [Zetaproteobacteria bacterium]
METIFDKILRGEIPCEKVYEDDVVLAFKDIQPQAPVHVLVIPKYRISGFQDIKGQEEQLTGAFFRRVAVVASELGLESGYRVVVNQGQDGGQEIEYLHAHILGRRQMQWPPG